MDRANIEVILDIFSYILVAAGRAQRFTLVVSDTAGDLSNLNDVHL